MIILEIYHEEIVREIHGVDFLTDTSDETSGVSNICQMIVILRYIVIGKPREKFWNFFAPERHEAKTLTTCLLKDGKV